jgi:UDP-N-acetyl-D-mannosaminuronic acid dehydrogenase
MEKVCVLGLGYVGLPTACLLASHGFRVYGVDINPQIIETLSFGKTHIVEPGLADILQEVFTSGNLTVSTEPQLADVFIIAVPTPFKGDHVPDISYIESATKSISSHISPGNLVILESTSPVGTTEKIADWLKELRPDLDIASSIYIAHCPERVLPGNALAEIIQNDRVIGGINNSSTEKAVQLYQKFVQGEILATNARTAELAKLTENSFRDVNIAFANELSMICDKLNIDVWELIKLANHHPRVNILNPGPGVGGHCIAVDPWFIVDAAPEMARLIRTAREVNDSKPDFVVAKVKEAASKFKNPKIACLGLSYKPDIDDLRESPAIKIVEKLLEENLGSIFIVEPHIQKLPDALKNSVRVQLVDLVVAYQQCNIIVTLVKHKCFDLAVFDVQNKAVFKYV